LIKIADQAMNKICRTTGEAVNLGILDPNDNSVLYIHKYDSSYNLSMNSTLGRRNPLHSTSLGKALLAWKSPDEQDYILGQLSYDPLTENTVTDATTLRQHLDRTKQNGFAEEIEESELGVRCMAVPIFDHLGRVIAAISVGFPLFRFVDEKKLKILDLMKKQAMDASVALGFKP
jgi:IclR family KDG regulon transcriptional repressor